MLVELLAVGAFEDQLVIGAAVESVPLLFCARPNVRQ
jgi:hypothetical protein